MTVPRRWRHPLKFVHVLTRLARVPDNEGVQKFVVLSSPRSGTTWLIDLLDSHADITCFSEVFAHDHFGITPDGGKREVVTWDSYATLRLPQLGRLERFLLYFKYLDEEIYTRRHGTPIVGFKMMYAQVERGFGIPAYLKARKVSLVHLIRHNHLDVILSEEALRVRKYHHAGPGAEVEPVKIKLEAPTLETRLESRDAMISEARRFYSQLGVPYYEIAYEDLSADRSIIEGLLRFLNVDPAKSELSCNVQRLNPKAHRDLIANYDEIERTLRKTRFSHLLH